MGGKSKPTVKPAPPAPEPTKRPASAVKSTRDDAKAKAALASGIASTTRTSPTGLNTSSTTSKKRLMGQ